MTFPTITPDWRAPAHVHAFTTTRAGGVSAGALATFNLGVRSQDLPAAVAENRSRLCATLPSAPHWLHQVHGVQCVEVTARDAVGEHTADAAVTRVPGAVLVVLTADCLPVFFSDQEGSVVAVAHAGWRGLCQGVLEATVKAMAVHPDEIIAHLGPAIGPAAFEVGPEVREVFVNADPAAESAFRPGVRDRFMADLPTLARQRLARLGVLRVSGGEHCTFSRPDLFYSHRRDPLSGRMASIIWRDTPL